MAQIQKNSLYKKAELFNSSGATKAVALVALDISKAFDRVCLLCWSSLKT